VVEIRARTAERVVLTSSGLLPTTWTSSSGWSKFVAHCPPLLGSRIE
jgi:hypothetical protein